MNADDQNQNFDKLQHLLKIKRYEQPPPRFFNDFSGQVTARLRAGETAKLDTFEEAVSQSPWLRKLWRAIEGRPAVSGIFAAGICGLALIGSFLSGQTPMQPGLALEPGNQPVEPAEKSLLATVDSGFGLATFSSNTNSSSLSPGAKSLFNLPLGPNLQPQSLPVNFQPSNQ